MVQYLFAAGVLIFVKFVLVPVTVNAAPNLRARAGVADPVSPLLTVPRLKCLEQLMTMLSSFLPKPGVEATF